MRWAIVSGPGSFGVGRQLQGSGRARALAQDTSGLSITGRSLRALGCIWLHTTYMACFVPAIRCDLARTVVKLEVKLALTGSQDDAVYIAQCPTCSGLVMVLLTSKPLPQAPNARAAIAAEVRRSPPVPVAG